MRTHFRPNRRQMLAGAAATATTLAVPGLPAASSPIMRRVPSTGEMIPAIGLGTWVEFNVGNIPSLRENCLAITRQFLEAGGGMIDGSPMYGTAEDVIGWSLEQISDHRNLVAATKIWTPGGGDTETEMRRSLDLWHRDRFDVLQVHNLVDWEQHLPYLFEAKAEGRIGYVGITTSHGSRHAEMEKLMRDHRLDFIQLTYNALDRGPENRLLPLAQDRGIAVIANRPFRRGGLFEHVGNAPLPAFVDDYGIRTWSQFFLKFILAHPAITCAIPATSVLDHLGENMAALVGPLPDQKTAQAMAAYVEAL